MLDLHLGEINLCNPIKSQMGELIETFVALHGEERRGVITERLQGATFLFLPRVERGDLERSYYDYYCREFDKADEGQREQLANQYKVIKELFSKVSASISRIDQKTDFEIKAVILEYLPELFGMTREEFAYSYGATQINEFVSLYLGILDRGRDNFADETTLTSYYKQKYLNFFRKTGVELGNNLLNYVEDEEFMDRLFDEVLQEDILEIKERNEILKLENDPFFQDAVKEIRAMDILDGNITLIQIVYQYMYKFSTTTALVQPYMKKDGTCGCLCLLPLVPNLQREVILHECEHIVEMCFARGSDGELVTKSGFDIDVYEVDEEGEEDYDGTNLDFEFGQEEYEDRSRRDCEVISEVWNDLFARILYQKSKECGLTIGEEGLSETWYVKIMRFLSDKDCHLGKILDARMNNDANAFVNLFGQEISAELNRLVNDYYDCVTLESLKFRGFEIHLSNSTNLPITEVDFFNLPLQEKWSGFEKSIINLHQQMYLLAQKIDERLSGGDTGKEIQQGVIEQE